jgi:hypothetical protein
MRCRSRAITWPRRKPACGRSRGNS